MGHTEALPLRGEATATSARRGAVREDRRARNEFYFVLSILLVTLAVSLLQGKDVFIFAYIMAVVVAVGGPRRHNRPWSDLGIKRGFLADLRKVWYLAGLDAIVFQLVAPTIGIAFVLGFGRELVDHITGRLPVDFTTAAGLGQVGALLALALALTLVEEIVFRVMIQDRLRWWVGTPAAIVIGAILFGLAHAVGATGDGRIVLTDVAGVVLDGIFFGLIYAKTHNLLLTWATHYAADVFGIVALVTVLRLL